MKLCLHSEVQCMFNTYDYSGCDKLFTKSDHKSYLSTITIFSYQIDENDKLMGRKKQV